MYEETTQHLNMYYNFYMNGIIEAFLKHDLQDESLSSNIPKSFWRWRCDPPIIKSSIPNEPLRRDHIETITYARLYDYETTFVADERNLSLTQTCRESCDMYDGSYSSIPCEEDNWGCLEQEKNFDCYEHKKLGIKCPGKARKLCPNSGLKCQTTKLNNAQVCKGQQQKRYIEWIDGGDKNIYGKKTDCKDKDIYELSSEEIMERSAITKYEPQRCEICLCKCYEPLGNDTHRYISLIPQIADIANGWTLVGMKFIKLSNVIHIMIAEAKLNNGVPDSSTIRWKQPNKEKIHISDKKHIFHITKTSNHILLDDFITPPGHIISGLKFSKRRIPRYGDYQADSIIKSHVVYLLNTNETYTWNFGVNGTQLGLEVQMTPLSSDGVLNINEAKWMSNKNTSHERKEVKIVDPDDSTLSLEPSLPVSLTNEYVVIQRSSITKDAGQTPVPFFDTQEVLERGDELSCIRGVGLFYKGQPGYGGFLAFRSISLLSNDSPPNPTYNLWKLLKKGTNKK